MEQIYRQQNSAANVAHNNWLQDDREDEIINADCALCGDSVDENDIEYGLCPKCQELTLGKWESFVRGLSQEELDFLEMKNIEFQGRSTGWL